MKRSSSPIITFGLILMFCTSTAFAQAPQIISYQGRLSDAAGDPVTDGSYILRFTIYGEAAGGAELWTSDFREVPVDNGLFTYALGDSTVFPTDLFSSDAARYLGIKVGGDSEIEPRTRLLSVAYAIHSQKADSASVAVAVVDDAITSTSIQDGTILLTDIGQNGASAGQIVKWSGSAWETADVEAGDVSNWTVSDSVLYTNNYLGIANGGVGNVLYGDSVFTHMNLGVGCTTGTDGVNSYFPAVLSGKHNVASGNYSTVTGGSDNYSTGHASTVGGGAHQNANGAYSTLSGGHDNTVSGDYSTVCGGNGNFASGEASTVCGGSANTASGDGSYAAGNAANAIHHGAFVWADLLPLTVSSSAQNQFTARTSGGARFFTNSGLSTGVQLAAGGGSWASVSDRNVKENIRPVKGNTILKLISQLEVSRWNYETQDESIEHIGPMAQDFYRLFGVGDNNTTITSIDADGISLAAIQALLEKMEVLEKRIAELEAESE